MAEHVEGLAGLGIAGVRRGGGQRVGLPDLDALAVRERGQLRTTDPTGAGQPVQVGGGQHAHGSGRVEEPGTSVGLPPGGALVAAAQSLPQRFEIAALGGGEDGGELPVLGFQAVDDLAVLELAAGPPPALPDLLDLRRHRPSRVQHLFLVRVVSVYGRASGTAASGP